ncbi:hypothetical protein Rumeso_02076 [Rubellimicrobium mesophilum DSM 19309]|uniref:Uncharacterized protein n=1 Tax=Rubellimicrobium mesophilum DSM 19309 TaxID=442562 RepID=A0A017HQ67_9RHOB|nr:hypothetical protein [Rubellimicrobium mesophilum]EYD76318.1 hypothetical protein Rumeso_02076 [Rubellimicrobium mesophilum DSM 19309]
MRYLGLLIGAHLLLTLPALAEERSEVMLDLMARVPTAALVPVPGEAAQVRFGDQAAARAAMASVPLAADVEARLAPFVRVDSGSMSPSEHRSAESEMAGLVGFGEDDIEATLTYGLPPNTTMLLRLDTDAAAQVAPTLLANGYHEAEQDGVVALIRGDVDCQQNLATRNPADPFGGRFGRSSRVVVDETVVTQTCNWPTLLEALGQRGAYGHPDLAVMGQVIDQPEWGDVTLLQATTLFHQLDLGPVGSGGPPPWQVGLMADLSSATETVTLVMFSYRNRGDAEAAAARIADGWDQPGTGSPLDAMVDAALSGADAIEIAGAAEAPPAAPSLAEITGAAAETGVAGEGPFIAWVALRRPAEATQAWPVNPAYSALLQAMFNRQLALLGLRDLALWQAGARSQAVL